MDGWIDNYYCLEEEVKHKQYSSCSFIMVEGPLFSDFYYYNSLDNEVKWWTTTSYSCVHPTMAHTHKSVCRETELVLILCGCYLTNSTATKH